MACDAPDIQSLLEGFAASEKRIVIVGAGVSTEAGLMAGDEIVQRILKSQHGALVRLVGRLADEPTGDAFFDVLAALQEAIGEEAAWNYLRRVLSPPEASLRLSETYEFLAHLLHHGQIDAIVSLNFDELLDEALELESQSVDPSKIIRPVASLSDFTAIRDALRAGGALPNRQYLKPHGTIGRRRTIRLVRDHVRRFEPDKKYVLRQYLKGAAVIALGWRARDPDLVKILLTTSRAAKAPKTVVVRRTGEATFAHSTFVFRGGGAAGFANRLLQTFQPEERVESVHDLGQRSVGALRHKIRSTVFAEDGNLTLKRQLVLEILMFALKARGQFEPHVLFDCPRTTNLLRSLGQNIASVLSELCDEQVLRKHDRPSDDALDVREPLYSLHLDDHSAGVWKSPESILTATAKRASDEIGRLFGLRETNIRNLADQFAQLTRTFDIDMVDDPRQYAAFMDASPLRSPGSLRKATEELLERISPGGNDELYVSTYTGEWLGYGKVETKLSEVKPPVRLIVDDWRNYPDSPYGKIAELRIESLAQKYPGHLNRRLMIGKVHNMTARARDDVFLEAIYFRREAKSTQVSPVLLRNRADCALLKHWWDQMWRHSKSIA